MKECSKAFVRRSRDGNFVARYFVGRGIDIGGAPDPLALQGEFFPRITELRAWDIKDGDAQLMAGIADETFDFVHSSHCLEHLNDPAEGLRNWFRILKSGGHLIVTVPDEDLYEQGRFPSTFNADHKWTFTTHKQRSWSSRSLNLLTLVTGLGETAALHKIELLDSTYRYNLPRFDQTLTPFGEASIEIVVRKRPATEIERGGRLPNPGASLSEGSFHLLTGIRTTGSE